MTTTQATTNGHPTQTMTDPAQTLTRGTQDRPDALTLVLPASVRAQLDAYRGWYYPGQDDVPYKVLAEEMLAIAYTRGNKDNKRAESQAARIERLAG